MVAAGSDMMQARAAPVQKDLVLVGGGHAHAFVLKSFGMAPIPGVRVTLVTDVAETPYSGMLPGFIAGHYTREACHIDLFRLAEATGTRLILARANGIDRVKRRVALEGRPPLAYDALSLDLGSTPVAKGVPGAAEYTTPVKPISTLSARWQAILDRVAEDDGPRRFLIVGAGAAGVEVTLSMQHRLRGLLKGRGRDASALSFAIVTREGLLPTHNASVQGRFRRILAERGIALHESVAIAEVRAGEAVARDGRSFAFDEALWVTQAAAAAWLSGTGLSLTDDGFLAITDTLQVANDPLVFAAGDCATSLIHPRPKAGVFAVRQGPPLAENLRLALTGKAPRPFTPQRAFLSLIGTGDGSAVASRGSWATEGRSIWRLKDWIDRRWMAMYQSFTPASGGMGEAAPPADPLGALPDDPMRCGGCAAKIGADVLGHALARLAPRTSPAVMIGLDAPDDAAVLIPPKDGVLLQTIDYFRAFVSDPYVFGRIAANHALGDVHAMGARPISALAIATLPPAAPEVLTEDLYQMLRGGLDVIEAAGAVLAGGHSSEGAEMALGFAINATAPPDRLLRKGGAQPGDALILTKPLGTGVLFAAQMRGRARGPWVAEALASMQRSNSTAADVLLKHGAHAATDVTGFGLAGHLHEMLRASQTAARLSVKRLPLLPGALELAREGIASTMHPANIAGPAGRSTEGLTGGGATSRILLHDPQTAGGLLAAVPAEASEACLADLHAADYAAAAVIGTITSEGVGALRIDDPI
jgi:selenide,water dikinase